jgi:hypothetical protein
LVASLRLDEGTGTTTTDAANGHVGTLQGGASWTSSAKIGSAIDFDASNGAVIVPHAPAFALTSLTIAVWVYKRNLSSYRNLVGKGRDGATARAEWLLETFGDEISFSICTGVDADCAGQYQERRTTGLNLTTGAWRHLAVTFDTSSNAVQYYVDGALFGTASIPQAIIATTHDIHVGRMIGGEATDGILDDVRIYNRVLDATEIGALYGSGAGCP